MKDFKVLIEEENLKARIKEEAQEIMKDYKGKELVVITVLRGAIFFSTELTLHIENKMILDFVQTGSYGNEQKSSQKVKLLKDISEEIEGKDVLIVEDIIDTGYTLEFLKQYLLQKKPASLKIAVLLDKPERRKVEMKADYVGFTIPNKFVVGFGFDIENCYRNLPYIGYVE